MTPIELSAVLLGLANIVLLVRRSVWNYPFALAMVSLYALIFWRERLYSDALLQGLFFVLNLWGWALWSRKRAAAGEVVVRRMTRAGIVRWAGGGALALLLWGSAEARWTDAAYPWLDAAVAIASVIAQVLLARRFVENWPLWIGVDALSILLYGLKGLYLTAGLYSVLLALALWGWREWRAAPREQRG